MGILQLLIIAASFLELCLLLVVVFLFLRLKKSEALLAQLQQDQQGLLDKMQFNAQLEQELVSSFQERQKRLVQLDKKLQQREKDLRELLQQVQEYSRSPQLIRRMVLSGHQAGESLSSLARKSGLSEEEVEWIIEQSTS
ncbi:MAG: hypothetical protein ACLFRL_06240 [Desulfohalobiaceae bacterium]